MPKGKLKHRDAELTLQLYDLRRETVMRASRSVISGKFWPKTFAEVEELLKPDHEYNAAYRQVATYWEMVYSFARNDIMDPDFLAENNAEGLFFLAKVYPFLDELREKYSPLAFRNAEWLLNNSEEARRRFDLMRARVERMISEKK